MWIQNYPGILKCPIMAFPRPYRKRKVKGIRQMCKVSPGQKKSSERKGLVKNIHL